MECLKIETSTQYTKCNRTKQNTNLWQIERRNPTGNTIASELVRALEEIRITLKFQVIRNKEVLVYDVGRQARIKDWRKLSFLLDREA